VYSDLEEEKLQWEPTLCNNYSTILFQVYPELEGAGVGANLCNNYSKLSIKEEVSFSGNTSLQ
jgi:hypothetical protein